MLDGEITDEEWDEIENQFESEDEGEDEEEKTALLSEDDQPQPIQTEDESTIDPELKADLEYLNRIESVITTKKKGTRISFRFWSGWRATTT